MIETIIQGKKFTYNKANKSLTLGDGQVLSEASMNEAFEHYLGANRIHKPMGLLFWTDCKNGNEKNWV